MPVNPTTAIVLGAGLGTRMRPLSDATPKPLIALSGETLIDRVLDRLVAAGVEKAVVNVHHLADRMEAHLARRGLPDIVVSDERGLLLETGGGVKKALPLLGTEPFYIHNSDSVWIEGDRQALPAMAAAWNPAAMDWLLLLAPVATSIGYAGRGDFAFADDGVLRRRAGDESVPYVFAGVSIAGPGVFEGAPEGAFSLNLLWDEALRAGRLCGLVLDGVWMHVGTPAALEEAEKVMSSGAR